jgi:hypothetical protein
MRHFSDARPAPGSPAVDDDSFAGKGPYELGHKVGSFNIRRFKKTGAKWGFDQRFSKTVAGGAAGSLGKGTLARVAFISFTQREHLVRSICRIVSWKRLFHLKLIEITNLILVNVIF